MPVLPSSLINPLWQQFAALLPERPEFDPTHPVGVHRRRIPDRVVFEHVIAALVHGSGYERIASPGCSDRTIRRRLAEWAEAGLGHRLHQIALSAYERMIGLDLDDLSVDGSITKAIGGGDYAGRSPVDRGKGGTKRSVLTEGTGVPLHLVCASANRHDSPLLEPTLAGLEPFAAMLPPTASVHLDAGYDSATTRALLRDLGLTGHIATKGIPAPIQTGKRWVVERTHSWINGYGKLRRITDRSADVIEFYTFLAAAITVIRSLIRQARTRYRWDTRPTTRRLP